MPGLRHYCISNHHPSPLVLFCNHECVLRPFSYSGILLLNLSPFAVIFIKIRYTLAASSFIDLAYCPEGSPQKVKSSSVSRGPFQTQLREIVRHLVAGPISKSDLRSLLQYAHAVAAELVKLKFRHSPALQNHIGLTSEDLAYDCIADLFERDASDTLVHFRAYFSSFNVKQFSEADTLIHFRRLVASAVNQNIVRVFGDSDPSLRKIMRNISLTIGAHKTFEQVERFDETCIVPVECKTNEHLPEFDLESLTSLLVMCVQGDEFVPELLAHLSRGLREQHDFSRIVHLTDVALAFRSVILLKQANAASETFNTASNYELEDLIKKSVSIVYEKTGQRYEVRPGGGSEMVRRYFDAVEYVLLSKVDSNGSIDSLFEGLKRSIPGLTAEAYRAEHRTRMEYFYTLCRNAVASEIVEAKSHNR
jgi:hypothetical protein